MVPTQVKLWITNLPKSRIFTRYFCCDYTFFLFYIPILSFNLLLYFQSGFPWLRCRNLEVEGIYLLTTWSVISCCYCLCIFDEFFTLIKMRSFNMVFVCSFVEFTTCHNSLIDLNSFFVVAVVYLLPVDAYYELDNCTWWWC